MTGFRMNQGVRDPELRFARATKWGEPSSHRPDLGSCLLFLGADNGNGYGQFAKDGKNGYAHRYAWERAHGPIPDGMTVDHLCRVRRCVNVNHMELTDRVDNYLRGVATRGLPDGRVKYNPKLRAQLVEQVVSGKLTVAQAAKLLGCSAKYMDKLTRRQRNNGGWTESKTRQVVRRRSDGWCEACGLAAASEMHHRKNRSQLGAWHPVNILHVCGACHLEITAHPRDAVRLGHSVRSHEDPRGVSVFYRGTLVMLDDLGNVGELV